MKGLNTIIIFLLLSLASFAQNGQMVNQGQLYVKPGTLMTVMSDFDNTEDGEYVNDGEVLLRGHFNNDGITTFTSGEQGYTRFEGFYPQEITGGIPADFNDVLFRNSTAQPAFKLFGDISVSGNADFYQGIVQDDVFGGIITFENNATHTNVSNESHVDGHVVKNGNTDFSYPIGDRDSIGNSGSYYRYAAISAPAEEASSFTGKYYLENSNDRYPHINKNGVINVINDKEYWAVYKDGGSSDIMLTLSWDTATTPQLIANKPYEEIHIVRWVDHSAEGLPGLWVDEGGVAEEVTSTTGTVTTAVNVNGYGIFTLARVKTHVTLPGDIVVYNGVTPNGDGENDYFIIDKLKDFPNNTVEIYNRWGVKIFETKAYDTQGNVFTGYSEGRATITGTKLLPSGTYFYVIEYLYDKPGVEPRYIRETGYLYLSSD